MILQEWLVIFSIFYSCLEIVLFLQAEDEFLVFAFTHQSSQSRHFYWTLYCHRPKAQAKQNRMYAFFMTNSFSFSVFSFQFSAAAFSFSFIFRSKLQLPNAVQILFELQEKCVFIWMWWSCFALPKIVPLNEISFVISHFVK